MLCTELTKISQVGGAIVAEPLYCRSWGCPICAPRRQKELRGKAQRGKPTTFITLTVNPAWGGSPTERAKKLVKAWRNIRQQLARAGIAKKIPFLAVFEQTKRGEPHLHIICRAPFIPQAWLSSYMRRYMDAPIVDIRAVKTARGVAIYISKYLSKDAHQFDGCKRYWASQDWKLPTDENEESGRNFVAILRKSFDEVMWDYRNLGITQAETLDGRYIRVGFWSNEYVWRPPPR